MNFKYTQWDNRFGSKNKSVPFDTLWNLFQELLTISSADVAQALRWLTELDKEYRVTDQFDQDYSIGDFMEDLKDRGYIENDDDQKQIIITRKTERSLRQKSLEEIFKNLEKGGLGSHKTQHTGKGLERQPEARKWNPGSDIGQIDTVGTMLNMLNHSSIDNVNLHEDDISVYDTDHYTSVSTVLLIDISHSMILYGEDRITPAKKVAMALSELIMTSYAKDSLDIT